jgi:hypothetical protein
MIIREVGERRLDAFIYLSGIAMQKVDYYMFIREVPGRKLK